MNTQNNVNTGKKYKPRGAPFKPGNAGKPKGAEHTTTKIKKAIGATTWEAFSQWMVEGGLEKLKAEMETLSGKDYIVAHSALFEYVKPKLIRSDNRNINVNIDKEDINFI